MNHHHKSQKEGHSETTEPTQPNIENNTPFEIEHNVPVPEIRQSIKYPFASMQKGDSFFVPGNEESRPKQRLVNAASRYGKLNKKKFIVRDVKDDKGNVTGARCWRSD